MNINREIEDALEILQNRRKIAIKSARSDSTYSYGRVTAFNECIAILKDIKKRMDRAEKIEEHHKELEKTPMEHNIYKENDLPVV